jgi:hypothetical protein
MNSQEVITMKTKTRKANHNIGSHSERMIMRKALRAIRKSTEGIKTGKYIPSVEDKKHYALDNIIH